MASSLWKNVSIKKGERVQKYRQETFQVYMRMESVTKNLPQSEFYRMVERMHNVNK